MQRTLFNEEHHLLRQSLKQYIQQKILPRYEAWEQAGVVPREIWLEAGRQGWLCPTASERFGGLGENFLTSIIVGEELFYHAVSGVFWGLHNDIVFPYLQHMANDQQQARFVPGCIKGECILAVAMTEPGTGSDLANIQAKAVKDGDDYVVNGSKTFISNGQLADLFVVAVRTAETDPKHRGISLLLVEGDRPGLSRGRNLEKIGLHSQDTSEIFFEDCRVPRANLLGEEGMGFKYLMQNLQQERLHMALCAVAAARGALDLTLDYVNQRQAFGKPIGKFQHVRFELAELATKVQVGQSFVDDLLPRHLAGENIVREVSMAKYWCTDMQFEVADRCLQLFGGYGYMREYPISRHFVDARVQRIYGGTNEIMKELIARNLGI